MENLSKVEQDAPNFLRLLAEIKDSFGGQEKKGLLPDLGTITNLNLLIFHLQGVFASPCLL